MNDMLLKIKNEGWLFGILNISPICCVYFCIFLFAPDIYFKQDFIKIFALSISIAVPMIVSGAVIFAIYDNDKFIEGFFKNYGFYIRISAGSISTMGTLLTLILLKIKYPVFFNIDLLKDCIVIYYLGNGIMALVLYFLKKVFGIKNLY